MISDRITANLLAQLPDLGRLTVEERDILERSLNRLSDIALAWLTATDDERVAMVRESDACKAAILSLAEGQGRELANVAQAALRGLFQTMIDALLSRIPTR